MQKARSQSGHRPKTMPLLLPLVGTWFQDLFHSPPGVLFTFPSRYSFAIGHRIVFRLGRWSCQIQPGFLVSRLTQVVYPAPVRRFAYRTITLCGRAFQLASTHYTRSTEESADSSSTPLQPRKNNGCSLSRPHGLGSSPFARRYSGNHYCFLFLRVLRCFSSPGSPRSAYLFSQPMTGLYPGRVPPFGDPWINARLQLPMAFRSLPRPSSPSCAQASTSRPYSLDHSQTLYFIYSTSSALLGTTHSLSSLPHCQKAALLPAKRAEDS